jgi:hypothetical protein
MRHLQDTSRSTEAYQRSIIPIVVHNGRQYFRGIIPGWTDSSPRRDHCGQTRLSRIDVLTGHVGINIAIEAPALAMCTCGMRGKVCVDRPARHLECHRCTICARGVKVNCISALTAFIRVVPSCVAALGDSLTACGSRPFLLCQRLAHCFLSPYRYSLRILRVSKG